MRWVRRHRSLTAHDLRFDGMQPLGPGDARPLSDWTGTAIQFVLPDPAGIELWLRNAELRP